MTATVSDGFALEALHAAPNPRPLRAVIYARVSQDPKQQLRSVSQQLDECRAECDRRGWTVVKVFKDNDRSASRYATKDRPEYAKLKTFLSAGEADVLVTWESSRAQRDLQAYVTLRAIAEDNGVQWSYKGRLYDLSRTDDRFTTGLDALLDERESGITRDRILRDKRTLARTGRPNGRMLYGYAREYDLSTGAFVRSLIREDQAKVVREAVRRFAAGESFATLARNFNQRGLHTNQGNFWYPITIKNMITNPAYIGKRVHQGEVIGEAEWPAILVGKDRQDFYTCAQRLNSPVHKGTRPGKAKYLLSGIGKCGVCGGKLTVVIIRKKKPSTKAPVVRYKCRGIPTNDGNCVNLTKVLVDEHITSLIIERLSRPDAAELLADHDAADDVNEALAEAAEKRARLERFYDQAAAGELSDTGLAKMEQRLLPEIEDAERRTKRIAIAPVLRDVVRPDIAEVWPDLPLWQKREVAQALMDVTIMPSLPLGEDAATHRQQRQALSTILGQLRRDCGIGQRKLAHLAGWPWHKISNAERAQGTPTPDEVRLWCRLTGADDRADELVALIPTQRVHGTDRIQIVWKHDL